MNLNAFNQSIKKSYETADGLGLFPRPINLFSITNTIDIRELEGSGSYIELYKKIVDARNLNFFFLYEDFFQFSFRGGSFRYAYYASPFVPPKDRRDDMLMDAAFGPEPIQDRPDEEHSIPEPQIDGSGFVVRYEYSVDEYTRLTHPCAHIHLGWNKSGRLAVKRVWTPLMFAFFIFRHLHSAEWFQFINERHDDMDGYAFDQIFRARRHELERVNVSYFHDFEEGMVFLD
jgi:hypothetical protein